MTKAKNSEKLFDLRTIEHLLAQGKVSQKEYETYLKTLPDDEDNYDVIDIQETQEAEAGSEGEEMD